MSEIRRVSRHAATILVGQLAVMAFGVADTVIAGRYSDAALAALSVGSALYISVYVGLIGIVQALLPIWAEMLGARRHEAVGRSLRQSLYLCGFICIAGMAALLFPGVLLRWAQVPALMQDEVQRYLAVLAFAFAPSLLFRLYSTLNQSLGKPRLVTWLQIAALGLKIPLSIWLVAGGGGIDAMGAVGCAWATLAVNYLLLLLAVLMLRTQGIYQPYAIWRRMERPDWPQLRTFARLGIPGGLAYLVEVTSFTLMALFIARLGTIASASHQIAASVAAVLYMMPLSMAVACSARVSFWLGAGRPDHAKRVVFMGLKLTALIALALAAIFSIAGQLLAGWYSASPEVVALASTLLVWVAFYHVADALQALCAFLLRCYRITMAPLALYGVLLWGLGLFGGYQLAYVGLAGHAATQAASSFWAASTLAIALVAACLLGLLLYAVRRSSPATADSTQAA
ncbi:MATE family efflux transporter [Polaromonas naphthalenivorans]|uniref:MATE efflux family protein n=1 Tax=Polaromonas naphthalenivorans (strain CJ2) TaxID=365044 RepID=A1VPC9_POLNA|nr:MATE family efflux transporter [Polaromonas naphthalenivorans]ABM37507.1 MATE efflux family protein [Polaromonas naphthalenivorans CJ2]